VLESAIGVLVFTAIVMVLVVTVLVVRARLAPSGTVEVVINDERRLAGPAGTHLLETLSSAGILFPSACGGKGTCGLCRIVVRAGGGAPLPMESDLISRRDIASGVRLACQVKLTQPVAVRVPEEILGVRELRCRVRSNRNVATFMKELILDLPPGEVLDFQAGAFVQLTAPPFHARFADFDVDAPYRDAWERMGLLRLEVDSSRPETRAYSLANHPGEKDIVMLVVRIATPPPGSPDDAPPGIVSSYIFQLAPGDEVSIAGPFGNFHAEDTEREMVFVGGGAGMAPMRSHVFDQLERLGTSRKITFWYGARDLGELFYTEDFDRLAAAHENFEWHAALSEPKPDDDWSGPVGFIHDVLRERFLEQHPAPEDCEYYLCGPPMMIDATVAMLDELGVAPEDIHYDDFGA